MRTCRSHILIRNTRSAFLAVKKHKDNQVKKALMKSKKPLKPLDWYAIRARKKQEFLSLIQKIQLAYGALIHHASVSGYKYCPPNDGNVDVGILKISFS